MPQTPNDYRDAYPVLTQVGLMKQLTHFFAKNGIYGASAAISTPMTPADAQLIIDVFGEFLDTHQDMLGAIEVRR